MKERIFFAITLIVVLSLSLNAFIAFNETCIAFPDQCTDVENANLNREVQTKTIGSLVIQSAGYFLESQSSYLLFLNRIELSEISGIDYAELKALLNSTVDRLESSRKKYFELVNLAENTPMNQDIVWRLIFFDYGSFQRSNDLEPRIFRRVSWWLSMGDLRGAYCSFFNDVEKLLAKLRDIKLSIDNEKMPRISALWRINQKYCEMLLFGQYVTEIFSTLK
jgi:hypothetical protein